MTKVVTYIEVDVEDFADGSPQPDQTFRFAIATDYLPADIDCIPSIDSISFTPQKVSLGKDLGQRASLSIKFRDHKHIFGSESYDSGTFWGKWRGRYGTKLRGRNLRLIRGLVGQTITEMDRRHYIIDKMDGPTLDAVYTIEAKDVLKFADEDRAQAPRLSNGSLAGSIDNAAGSLTLSPAGIGDEEYPASGWVCLGGKEVVTFTRSSDTLTITRAQFGTVAQGHDAGDRVQLVKRFTGDDVADILNDLFVNFAGIPSDYIPLTDWQAETSEFLNVIYARTITEPTSVRKLASELIEQAAIAVWWDDRAQKIRLNVLREIDTTTDTFDQDQIITNSLKVREQPDKRISQIWSYYGERDPTDRGSEEDNYRAALANADLERETDYGSAEIRKISASWIETETAASRLNTIQLSRFRDPPRSFAFDLIRSQAVTPAGGYSLQWWGNQDSEGNEVTAPIQITQVTLHADRIHVEAEEMLITGNVVLVNVVFLFATDESVLEWDVPDTWNDDDNFIACIGGGGAGFKSSSENGGKGGGGSAFSRIDNLALLGSPPDPGSPGLTLQYSVGLGGIPNTSDGGDTWFGGATFGAALVAAEGGQRGTSRTGGGQGGQASNGTGDLKTSGGNGGNGGAEQGNRAGGGGGAGAGGPNGDGGNGGPVGGNERGGGGGGGADGGEDVTQAAQGSTGVDGGDNRFGFGGGDATTPAGQEGGGGKGGNGGQSGALGGNGEQIWTQTVAPIVSAGPGGGGGGGGAPFGPGGDGGNYGGGGGGSAGDGSYGGYGGPGLIVIRWREN